MTDTARKTHLVGAWPGRSAPSAIAEALGRLGPHLLRLSDGETGHRSQWITPVIEWMRVNPDVELVKDGDYSDYDNGPRFRVVEGGSLDPDNIHLQQSAFFAESYPAFCRLRERHDAPHVSFQVGIFAPIDLAVNIFGYEAAMADHSIAEAFARALLREIHAIHAQAGDDVIFQVESVVSMVAVARTPPPARAEVAAQMAGAIAALVANAPAGARFGSHICLGDFHHKALAEMGDAGPLVELANAVAKAWPEGRTLEYIHAPFAAADKPGSFDEAWYEPLSALDLPADVRFVAGFVHEAVDVGELEKILKLIERHAGRQVDVAAACGLGRRPDPNEAWDAMDKTTTLIKS